MKNLFCVIFLVVSFSFVKMTEVEIATYEEIKDLPNHPEKLLIDVREPHELQNTGSIPTSINIPRKSVPKTLVLPITFFSINNNLCSSWTSEKVIF